jgi:signal peptidase II
LEGSLNRLTKDYLYLGGISGLVVLLDQVSKTVVRNNLALSASWMPLEWLAPYFRFVHWYNTGVAFGLFQGANTFFIILAITIALVIIFYFPRVPAEDWSLRLAMSLQLGGAVGNMIDRIFIGHVTDFLSFGKFPGF